jgi:hypothetical protein
MDATPILAPVPGHSLATDLESEPPIGLDPIDNLPVRLLSKEIAKAADPTLRPAITEIHREGARGPALRRLLCRDIVLARVQLRSLEALRNAEMKRYAKRRPGDIVVPPDLAESEIEQSLDDLLHKLGGPTRSIRRVETP